MAEAFDRNEAISLAVVQTFDNALIQMRERKINFPNNQWEGEIRIHTQTTYRIHLSKHSGVNKVVVYLN